MSIFPSISCEPLELDLLHPFALAHGTTTRRQNVLVKVGSGLGEAACVPYRAETPTQVVQYVESLNWQELGWPDSNEPLAVSQTVAALPSGSSSARAAVDIALHDVWAQQLGLPLYRCLGLDSTRIASTSVTIAQAKPAEMADRVRHLKGSAVKLKLGGDPGLDEQRLQAVLAACEAPVRTDANGGWDLAQARWMLPRLAACGVELIEQPLAVGDLAGLQELSNLSVRPPIYVDESIETVHDIVAHANLVEGVVIKLAKAGGIAGALQQISVAKGLGLKVMLSCMVESSVAVTAAAHIAPLADLVDLDGPLLIADEPYGGVIFRNGRLLLPDRPGLGLFKR